MTNENILAPEHPGFFIAEELQARGWAKIDLAYVLGIDPADLSRILNGKVNVSPNMANSLGDAFDIPAEFFANLQKLYDLSCAEKPDEGIKTRRAWATHFPVREMLNRGWIEDSDPSLLHLQMLRFFNKEHINDVPFVGNGMIEAHAAKKSNYECTTPIQYVWLHRVKKIAEQIDCPQYSQEKLINQLDNIRAHMLDLDDLIHIPELLLKCGVRLVFVEAFSGSKIDGVCVWLNDQPVIGISLRLDKSDNFCFTLRHELEHIIQDDGREFGFMPVDEFDVDSENISQEEVIANNAAQNFLIPKEKLDLFIRRKSPYISERDMLLFSARMQIHPSVVVGQIQRATNKWGWLQKHIKKVRKKLIGWKYSDGWDKSLPTGL